MCVAKSNSKWSRSQRYSWKLGLLHCMYWCLSFVSPTVMQQNILKVSVLKTAACLCWVWIANHGAINICKIDASRCELLDLSGLANYIQLSKKGVNAKFFFGVCHDLCVVAPLLLRNFLLFKIMARIQCVGI